MDPQALKTQAKYAEEFYPKLLRQAASFYKLGYICTTKAIGATGSVPFSSLFLEAPRNRYNNQYQLDDLVSTVAILGINKIIRQFCKLDFFIP